LKPFLSIRPILHVSTLVFDTDEELKEYLESLGDEITGFYGCGGEAGLQLLRD
jgi:hypothetical protein